MLPWIGGVPPRLAAAYALQTAVAALLRPLPPNRLRLRALWQASWLGGAVRSLRDIPEGKMRTKMRATPSPESARRGR